MSDFRPKCPICGSNHFAREPHAFGKEVAKPSELLQPAKTVPVVEKKKSKPERKVGEDVGPERVGNGRTRAAYNTYMREYMRKKRAKTTGEAS